MGGRGGGLVVKEEEDIEIDKEGNYNKKSGNGGGISIAERRCGFNAASSINAARFSFFTVPPGLSPSALLDSPVMLHNAQGQLSPTTGTFQFHHDDPPSTIATADHQNKPFEEFEMKQVSRKAAIGHQEKHEKTSIEDGYLWRKYGQKHVKGSEYPRSYYKCTNPNCTVTKKVERCDQGQVSEIVYKGSHNHPEPLPSLKKNICELGVPICNSTLDDTTDSSFHLASLPTSTTPPTTTTLDQPDHLSDQSVSNDADENGDLISEPRKRKREMSYPNGSESGAPRCAREPKVVVQIESDIDILDDGYRWRKYGQKVVKGNPNPRSYYKCTTPGCGVRKHVERAANDIKSVITTYEGKHNHQVPSSKSLQVINSHSHSHHHNSSSSSVRLDHSAKQNMNVVDEEVAAVYLERKAYPLSFPPFHSLPAYPPSLLASTSKLYPLIPDYHVSSLLPSHINPHHLPPSTPPKLFHYNNVVYPSISNTSRDNNSHNMDMQVIPKEEQRDHDDADGLYDACLSLPNHPNATI